MNGTPLRLMTTAASILIIALLVLFTDVGLNVIISVAAILLFLILFTFAFDTVGHPTLNIFVIVFSFICLPLFVLWYLGILNNLSWPWGCILLALGVIILGMLSIATMVKLNYVELVFKRRL